MGKYSNLNTTRAYQRDRRATLKARGDCEWCGKRPRWRTKGRLMVTCKACTLKKRRWARDQARERRANLKKLGVCQVCQARPAVHEPGCDQKTRCEVCIHRDNQHKALRLLVKQAVSNWRKLRRRYSPARLYAYAALAAQVARSKGESIEIISVRDTQRWTDAPKVLGWVVDLLGGVELIPDKRVRAALLRKRPSGKPVPENVVPATKRPAESVVLAAKRPDLAA